MSSCLLVSNREFDLIDKIACRLQDLTVTNDLNEVNIRIVQGCKTVAFTEEAVKLLTTEATIKFIQAVNKLMNIKFVYFTVSNDSLVEFMQRNHMWDYYLNVKLDDMDIVQLITLINNKRVPDIDEQVKIDNIAVSEDIDSMLKLCNTLNNIIENEKDDIVKVVLIKNYNQLKVLVKTYVFLYNKHKTLDRENDAIIMMKDKITDRIRMLEEQNKALKIAFDEAIKDRDNAYIRHTNLNNQLKDLNNVIEMLNKHGVYNLTDKLYKQFNMNDLNIERYNIAPIVIYIKEYDYVRYTNTMMKLLPNIAKNALNMLSKVFILENKYSIEKSKMYKDCLIINKNTKIKDLLTTDYLVYFNNPYDIITMLMNNPIGIDVLFVIDRTHYDNIFIEGDKCAVFYTCESKHKIKSLELPTEDIITSLEKFSLKMEHCDNYEKLKGDILEVGYYSQDKVVNEILRTISYLNTKIKDTTDIV